MVTELNQSDALNRRLFCGAFPSFAGKIPLLCALAILVLCVPLSAQQQGPPPKQTVREDSRLYGSKTMRQGDQTMLEDPAISNDTSAETMLPDTNELNVQSGVSRLNDMPGSHAHTVPRQAATLQFVPGVGWVPRANAAAHKGAQGNLDHDSGSSDAKPAADGGSEDLDAASAANLMPEGDQADALHSFGSIGNPRSDTGGLAISGAAARNQDPLSRPFRYSQPRPENQETQFDDPNLAPADSSESGYESFNSAATKSRAAKPCAQNGTATHTNLQVTIGTSKVQSCSAPR